MNHMERVGSQRQGDPSHPWRRCNFERNNKRQARKHQEDQVKSSVAMISFLAISYRRKRT